MESVKAIPRQSLLALIWSSFSIACVFVILRTAIRFRITSRLVTEDYWMFFALATLLANSILQTIQLPSLYYMAGIIAGTTKPSTSLELISIGEDYLRYEFAIIGLFWTVLWGVKASFLALYFKLFRDVLRYRIAWYVLTIFTFLAYAGCWITTVNSCHPTSNFFVFAGCDTDEDVWASRMSVYYSTVVDIFTDLCIMAMPIKLIYNLQISLKQKAGLVCVFSLCIVMIVFAVTRAKQILAEDYFVNLTLLGVWSTLESSAAVVVGCLPAFKALISSRAATKRSQNTPNSFSNATKYRAHLSPVVTRSPMGNAVALDSVSHDWKSFKSSKSVNTRSPDPSDSQEAIAPSHQVNDSQHSIMVKNDVTVEYADMEGPPPVYKYQRHQPIINYGQAF